jgi:nicotinate dehydrogenase subunit B
MDPAHPPADPRARGRRLRGRGFAYALYVHSKFPGYGAAWAAWVADVAVNARTGEVKVEKVTVGHDAGLMINPDGVRHQIHGNVVQSTSARWSSRCRSTKTAWPRWSGVPIRSSRSRKCPKSTC